MILKKCVRDQLPYGGRSLVDCHWALSWSTVLPGSDEDITPCVTESAYGKFRLAGWAPGDLRGIYVTSCAEVPEHPFAWGRQYLGQQMQEHCEGFGDSVSDLRLGGGGQC